jgi:hypothetical protein
VRDIQVFLGFANFYRRFIKDFSKVCSPLTKLLQKGTPFEWTNEQERAFEELKKLFTTAPILQHFDPESPIFIETDASDFAIGGILSQKKDKLHPVAFHSRKLKPAEINYEMCEGAKHPITIYTDHRSLEYFATAQRLNRRQARWAEKLSAYDFKII